MSELEFIETILPALNVPGRYSNEQAANKFALARAMYVVRQQYFEALSPEVIEWIDRTAALSRPSEAIEMCGAIDNAEARYQCARQCWSLVFGMRMRKAGVH